MPEATKETFPLSKDMKFKTFCLFMSLQNEGFPQKCNLNFKHFHNVYSSNNTHDHPLLFLQTDRTIGRQVNIHCVCNHQSAITTSLEATFSSWVWLLFISPIEHLPLVMHCQWCFFFFTLWLKNKKYKFINWSHIEHKCPLFDCKFVYLFITDHWTCACSFVLVWLPDVLLH